MPMRCWQRCGSKLVFMGGIEFLKGHGTQNDFVVLPDAEARLELDERRVAALCDRRRGLGADGVLRVVRPAALGVDSGAAWFMDYRNADGSIAEMCGNGVRLFARYLAVSGLTGPEPFLVGTRAGDRRVTVHPDGSSTVEMGPASVTGASVTRVGGRDFSGIAVDVGNPHLVAFTDEDIAGLDLTRQPRYDADLFTDGVNLEFVNTVAPDRIRMRVHERGVGETRACGTGTVAAAAAMLHTAGSDAGYCIVEIPGGTVTVTLQPDGTMLTGPAEFVAHGELDETWWAAQ